MPPEAPPTTPPPAPLLKTVIPPDLHERGWAKDWLDKPHTPETTAELFKKLDGAETLIGKKTLIPGPDAKPEEVTAFYEKLRVAKPEDYEFKLGEKPDENFVKELRTAAHTAGLSKQQMAAFVEKLAPGFQARQKAATEAQAARDKEMDALVVTTFGKDNEKVVARVRGAMAEHAPENLKGHIDSLDNKSLALMAGVINAIMVKYMSEDDLNRTNNSGQGAGNDRQSLQDEARKLMASPAYKDFQHSDHEKIQKRLKEIYANPAFKS